MTTKPKKPTDWRKRFRDKKEPKVVVLSTPFAGIQPGATLYIATPGIIANYIARIPAGETRPIERMRNELARKNGANATCPVTTAIFLRVVAEAAWDDIQEGKPESDVVPFWRVIAPDSTIAKKLRCQPEFIAIKRGLEGNG